MSPTLVLLSTLTLSTADLERGLPAIDSDIDECRALVVERKGPRHRPSKRELYRVGNAAGLLCDTFTDEEWEQIYGDSDHD